MRKRKYLFRLSAVIILTLALPIIFFFTFFWKRSLNEMQNTNNVYYEEVCINSLNIIEENIKNLLYHTSTINVKSRESSGCFYKLSKLTNDIEYWSYEAMSELSKNFYLSGVRIWGVYVYDYDKNIMPFSVTTLNEFIKGYISSDEMTSVSLMFSPEEYETSRTYIKTLYNESPDNAALFVGKCTTVGIDNTKVFVYYMVSRDELNAWMSADLKQGLEYIFYDSVSEKLCMHFGKISDAKTLKSALEYLISEKKSGDRIAFSKKSELMGLDFAIILTQDSLKTHMAQFYIEVRNMIILTMVMLLFISLIAIFIAYRPVYRFVDGLDDSEGNEFEIIQNALNLRHLKLQEQENMIMELLLNHILYGVPTSESKLRHLGVNASYNMYSVLLIDGISLLNSEAGQISENIKKTHDIRLFITDWEDEKQSLVILFMKEDVTHGVTEYLYRWFKQQGINEIGIFKGSVVNRLDSIKKSLNDCLETRKQKLSESDNNLCFDTKMKEESEETGAEKRKNRQEKRINDILAFIDGHFTDPNLSQVYIADEFGISSFTLSRVFKSQVGIGFADYLISKRVEYAKDLLLTTSLTVTEISARSGFSNETHFSRTFKGHTGFTPSAYRKQ